MHSRPLQVTIEPGSTLNLVVTAARTRRFFLQWWLPFAFCLFLDEPATEWLLSAINVEASRLARLPLQLVLILTVFFGYLFVTRLLFPGYWALWTIEVDNEADRPAASSETAS